MIQRKQTLFLVLAALMAAAMFALPYPFDSLAAEHFEVFPAGVGLLSGALAAVSALTVFQYRTRASQLRSTTACIVLAVLLLAFVVGGFAISGDFARLQQTGRLDGWAALALPLVALVFASLARRGVAADIALVRSMDRLR